MIGRAIACLVILLLSGCATFVETRAAYQVDPWSDWVLQKERPWTPARSEVRVNLIAGLAWDRGIDCPYFDVMMVGPWDQLFIGCSKIFGTGRWYLQTQILHQIDNRTSDFLQTDQKQWQGPNPFFHLRMGAQWQEGRIKCPTIATGRSLFQGAPFEKEEGSPDLYWVNLECSIRWGGR